MASKLNLHENDHGARAMEAAEVAENDARSRVEGLVRLNLSDLKAAVAGAVGDVNGQIHSAAWNTHNHFFWSGPVRHWLPSQGRFGDTTPLTQSF